MISIIQYLHPIKWVVPAGIIFGTSPVFFSMWVPFRLVTTVMPSKVFTVGDRWFYSMYQRLVLFFFENYSGVEVVLYGDVDEVMKKEEKVLYLSNHQSAVDWVVTDMLAVRQGSLGNIRYVLKDELKYIPLYGFYFRQHGCVYVKRAKGFNENKAKKHLEELREKPFWLVVFPEGTRYNPSKSDTIKKSQQFAENNSLELLNYHLTPRHRATYLSYTLLKEKLEAVYDVTIAYSDTLDESGQRKQALGMTGFCAGLCPKIHIHLKRIDLKDIPSEEEEFRRWLHKLYVEKDKLLKRFYQPITTPGAGTLGNDGRVSPLSLRETLPIFFFWVTTAAPVFLTSLGRSLYLNISLYGSVSALIWTLITA